MVVNVNILFQMKMDLSERFLTILPVSNSGTDANSSESNIVLGQLYFSSTILTNRLELYGSKSDDPVWCDGKLQP